MVGVALLLVLVALLATTGIAGIARGEGKISSADVCYSADRRRPEQCDQTHLFQSTFRLSRTSLPRGGNKEVPRVRLWPEVRSVGNASVKDGGDSSRSSVSHGVEWAWLSGRWGEDIFPDSSKERKKQNIFTSVAPDEWLIQSITVVCLVVFDFLFLRSLDTSFRTNVVVVAFWIMAAAGYNLYFFVRYGREDGFDWCSGYILECLLSMDNLFVFHLIFKVYKTPKELLHEALFFGILGAIIFRLIFFLVIGTLVNLVFWVRFVFGLLLVVSGVQAAYTVDDDDDDDSVLQSWSVRFLKSCLGSRMTEAYDKTTNRLFTYDSNGRLQATLLVFVILCLELTDIIFAIDSVSAKIAQIPNQYIAYSSSVLAMFGLRSLFFIIEDLVGYFVLLKYGICIILIFIGMELVLADFIDLSPITVCGVIFSVFTVCIAGSAVKSR